MVCKITSVDQSKNLDITMLFKEEEMKNTLYYLFMFILGLPLIIISAIIYPIVFLFRHKVLSFMLKRVEEDDVYRVFVLKQGYKKWKVSLHPYCWMFWLTTGLTDQYIGPEWYKKLLKFKWFGYGMYANLNNYYSQFNFKQKLRYFYLCYCWQALRNSHWAFNEWFFREGKWKDDTVSVKYCYPAEGYIYKYWDITPQLKWDEGNDGGRVLRFPPDDIQANGIWLYTHLGKKKITFTTFKGNRRFMYAFCKVIYFRRVKLIIEHQFGWNWWNGIPILHFKHILRKN